MIASMSGTIANKGMYGGAYNASKAAVIQLARNLGAEWGPYGIRVNTISPGYIMTEMLQNLFVTQPHRKDQWASENMLGRLSLPHEFRGAGVFLISDASSFMTGSDLRIDGGHAACETENADENKYVLKLAERIGDDSTDWDLLDAEHNIHKEAGSRLRTEKLLIINGVVENGFMECHFGRREALRIDLAGQVLRELDEFYFSEMLESERLALRKTVEEYIDQNK
ncbi:hypothetical protein NLG97_g4824 [Lecanicillium saksenae]|uniref:Uncharacterized protein n=1 Tax=Lecanicillium saksenae TaxID=468837 RepID=A0ACC1QVX9_9HYPO|nr:hypothetical protein NLG97_g4824 [Lecanicillium saksenae]